MADLGGQARILCVIGTRPEAIKMAPVIAALRKASGPRPMVCVTGQHRELVDDILPLFAIEADFDLDLMTPRQDLAKLAARMLEALDGLIRRVAPHFVLVQGDTTTGMVASMAAHYRRVPVAHIEAGLRTGDLGCPWPEEANRRIIGALAAIHFAPTEAARRNLLAEGVASDSIHVTGNTIVDSLMAVLAGPDSEPSPPIPALSDAGGDRRRRLLLVTSHRRESFGAALEQVCDALIELARRPDVEILFPVHLNPHVREVVLRRLGRCRRIHLLGPLPYPAFVACMQRADILLTDSGGVQEEAAVLGRPVLVLRRLSERVEGIANGSARLVGTDRRRIVSEVRQLLEDEAEYRRRCRARTFYGDGWAGARIARILSRKVMAPADHTLVV